MPRPRPDGYISPLETMDPRERRDRKRRLLQEHLARAYAGCAAFRRRLDQAGIAPGDVRTFEDFEAIPVLRKKDLIALQGAGERLGGLLAHDFGTLRRIYQSPGPIFDPEGRGRDYWGFTEAFYAAGFRPGDVVQMTFSYHLTPAGHMLEEPLREIGCAVIPAGPGNTEKQIELLTSLPVTGFVGMASYLRVIGEKARAAGYDLKKDMGLQVAFVAAERLTETLRAEVEGDFGIVVRQGYGTADVGCIAYECRELGGMHVTSRGVVEICDPQTGRTVPLGQTGEVVFTPFCDAYPLVRLATGDLSRFVAEPCACGRTSRRLAGIVGRVDDTAKVKGQFIYPGQAAEVAARFPGIAGFRIVVDNPGGRDAITVELVRRGPVDETAFAAAFQDRLKLRPRVAFLPQGETLPENGPLLVDRRRYDN
ncbi:phenylacetate--CoA ligase family protein [Desulfolutivibrio sulfoxidireducens]|uniref:phenylacetate--CoA ligase family protein n=1 Tax=Desulfolutivibrio sulfoxidireducens TaxID=2773299 RepID=UPI00159DB6A2|nr:phenylacetate--CoA ligase family protein [Desulfolutivibrio sulfoxidireducens]QLA16635.1 AMP-binding protein [Desulfolutivibrio sulfoxidireducens]